MFFERAFIRIDNTSLTGETANVNGGDVNLLNEGSQLRVDSLKLDQARLSVRQENPLPTLSEPIEMRDSNVIASIFSGGTVTIPQGIHLRDGRNVITALGGFGAPVTLEFQGPLLRDRGVLALSISPLIPTSSLIKFTDVSGAAPGSPVFYASVNDTTFADFDRSTGTIVPFTNYVDINTAGPNDVAGVTGTQTMTEDTAAYAVRLGPSPPDAVLNGGGATLTTNSILLTSSSPGVNSSAQLNDIMVQPPDVEDGNESNEIITFGSLNTQNALVLTGVDILDNNAPTDWTISSANVTLNGPLSKTGRTHIDGPFRTVTLNGPTADLGGNEVTLSGRPTLRLVTNTLTQHIDARPETQGSPTIESVGSSRVEGDVSIHISTASEGRFTFANVDGTLGSLTLAGKVERAGSGNPVGGQGQAVVNLGSGQVGDGPIITEATADLTDPGIRAIVRTPQLRHEGMLGQTEVLNNAFLSGNGSYTSLRFSGTGSTLSPGSSIGTTPVTGDLVFDGPNNTFAAEVTDDGQSDLLNIGGSLNLTSDTDVLDISFASGTTLADAAYTLATYGAWSGIFDTVMFEGNLIADPTLPGAFQGTHQLFYGPTALFLTTGVVMLPGDYNGDGSVTAADYTVVRDTLGSTTDLRADGNGNGMIDPGDYGLFKSSYAAANAAAFVGSGQSIPEPNASILLLAVLASLFSASTISRTSCATRVFT
jgi:hypothetical protein